MYSLPNFRFYVLAFYLIFNLLSNSVAFPLPDFAVWFYQSSLVVDDWLYIDGGEYYTPAGQSYDVNILNQTLAINLAQSWTNATVNAYSTPKPSSWSNRARAPMMWYDPQSKYVYEWGGWTYNGASGPDLVWTFQPDGQGAASWTQNPQPAARGQNLNGAFGALTAQSSTRFFSLGGSHQLDNLMTGLATYDFSSHVWSNLSSIDVTGSDWIVGGRAHYSSLFGQEGILVFLGGVLTANQSYKSTDGDLPLADMGDINIYDIHSGDWHQQKATGEVPPGRQQFCSVSASPSSNSSLEIVIFGGATNNTYDKDHQLDEPYQSVYVLSLPAFTWFKAPDVASSRRALHTCQLAGKRQMVVVGGSDPYAAQNNVYPWRDPWTNGIGVLDITNLTWSDRYDAKAAVYEQPAVVAKHYTGASPTPISWNDAALAQIFATSSPNGIPNATPSSTGTSEGTQIPDPGTNTTTIIASVIGSVVGLAFLAGIAFMVHRSYAWRRRRRQFRGPHQLLRNEEGVSELTGDDKFAYQERVHELNALEYPELHGGNHLYEAPDNSKAVELPATK